MTMRVAFRARVLSMTVRWVSLSSALVASSKNRMRGRMDQRLRDHQALALAAGDGAAAA